MKANTFFFILILTISFIQNSLIQAQTNVSGEIKTNTTWVKSGSPYILTGDIRVRNGATLTIENGTQISLSNHVLYIGYDGASESGILQANGVTFNGTYNNNGFLRYEYKANGTVSNCTFTNTNVKFYSLSAPVIAGNSFDVYSPLYLYSEAVIPNLSNNIYGSGKFYISLTIDVSTKISNYANCTYYLDGDIRVRNGATLTIENGTQIKLSGHYLYVGYYNPALESGTLQADGVTFDASAGPNGNLQFEYNSTGTISNCSFINTNVRFENFSGPSVTNNSFDVNSLVYLHSQTVIPKMSGNNFGSGKFYISLTFTSSITIKNYANCTYYLDGDIRVRNGATLTIENGTQIKLSGHYLYVGYYNPALESGTLQADGVTFDASAGPNGNLQFEYNSTGTISNCSFINTNVRFENFSGPSVTNNSFDVNSLVYLHSQTVIPKMSGNNFGSGKFYISLTFTSSITIKNYANCTYYLDGDIRVRNGATLTIENGTQIKLSGHYLYVGYYNPALESGTLQADGVTFDASAGPNGNLQFEYKSNAQLKSCDFVGKLGVVGLNQSNVKINLSNFGLLCTVQNSSSIIMNAEYNYWGDPSGPKNSKNPNGKGATVGDNVDFIPFSSSPYSLPPPGNWTFSFPIIFNDTTYTILFKGNSQLYDSLLSHSTKPLAAQAEYLNNYLGQYIYPNPINNGYSIDGDSIYSMSQPVTSPSLKIKLLTGTLLWGYSYYYYVVFGQIQSLKSDSLLIAQAYQKDSTSGYWAIIIANWIDFVSYFGTIIKDADKLLTQPEVQEVQNFIQLIQDITIGVDELKKDYQGNWNQIVSFIPGNNSGSYNNMQFILNLAHETDPTTLAENLYNAAYGSQMSQAPKSDAVKLLIDLGTNLFENTAESAIEKGTPFEISYFADSFSSSDILKGPFGYDVFFSLAKWIDESSIEQPQRIFEQKINLEATLTKQNFPGLMFLMNNLITNDGTAARCDNALYAVNQLGLTYIYETLLWSTQSYLGHPEDTTNAALYAGLTLGIYNVEKHASIQSIILPVLQTSTTVPNSFTLYQNYPNPFNPTTTIRFEIKENSKVKLDVYDVLGQRVKEIDLERMSAGTYNQIVDMSRYTSGIYFYRMHAGNFVETKKMILLK